MQGLATQVKTLRLPPDVIELIESFPGNSFTDKFVHAARCFADISRLEEKRQQKVIQLTDMDKLLRKRDSIVRSLDEITWKISGTVQACKVLQEASAELLGSSDRK